MDTVLPSRIISIGCIFSNDKESLFIDKHKPTTFQAQAKVFVCWRLGVRPSHSQEEPHGGQLDGNI
jgi:hypothetical protein